MAKGFRHNGRKYSSSGKKKLTRKQQKAMFAQQNQRKFLAKHTKGISSDRKSQVLAKAIDKGHAHINKDIENKKKHKGQYSTALTFLVTDKEGRIVDSDSDVNPTDTKSFKPSKDVLKAQAKEKKELLDQYETKNGNDNKK